MLPSDNPEEGVARIGDQLWAFLPAFADGAGQVGYSRYSEATTILRIDGREMLSVDEPLFAREDVDSVLDSRSSPGQRQEAEHRGLLRRRRDPEWFSEPGLFRYGEEFWAYVPTFADGADHPGRSRYSEAHSSLRLNGEEIVAADAPLFDDVFPVGLGTGPSEGGRFELGTEVTRRRRFPR